MIKTYPFKDYLLFAEAWVCLAFARILLLMAPFKRIAPLLGKPTKELILHADQLSESIIGLSILRASRFSPWRTKCFEQAIAGKWMLRMRGRKAQLFFGVKKAPGATKMAAHAWVTSNNELITGGNSQEGFVIISCFQD